MLELEQTAGRYMSVANEEPLKSIHLVDDI